LSSASGSVPASLPACRDQHSSSWFHRFIPVASIAFPELNDGSG
jgi:hypothetical protein